MKMENEDPESEIVIEEMENQLLKIKDLEIDLKGKKYRRMHLIFWFFRVGIWKPLPQTVSVAITKIKLEYRTSANKGQPNSIRNSHEVYCIILRSKRSNIRLIEGELEEIKKTAILIGEFLDKPVINYLEKTEKF